MGFEKRVALSGRTTLSAQCTAPMKIPCHCEASAHTGFAIRIPRLIGLLQARGAFGMGHYKGCGGQPFLWLAK